jgi:hypothetical protein
MMEAGAAKPAAFDVVIVHSFSRCAPGFLEQRPAAHRLPRRGRRKARAKVKNKLEIDPLHADAERVTASLQAADAEITPRANAYAAPTAAIAVTTLARWPSG